MRLVSVSKKIAITFYKFRDAAFLCILIPLSGVLHGTNMLHYPYFENDESTYFSQAWSFLSQGKLAPFTYWYDHSPFGWIFTAGWQALTGGLFTFGFSLNSARIFMLVIHLISTLLLYRVTLKITHSRLASVVAVLFFSLSPLAIYFQRRLLLDNLMTFWILLSLHFLLYARQRLWHFFLSAVTFGLAVLTKENGIFFLPMFFLLVIAESHPKQKLFAALQWIAIVSMVIGFYPVYALLKGELFQYGSLLGGTTDHVSLLKTLSQQASRGSGLPIWDTKSDFMRNFLFWLPQDYLLVAGGTLAFLAQGFLSIWHKPSRIIFGLTLCMVAFLMSGKLVINFYIIPVIPLFGMCLGYSIAYLVKQIWHQHQAVQAIIFLIVLLFIGRHYQQDPRLFVTLNNDETTHQLEMINWIKKNLPADSVISMDYYGNLDLTNSRFKGDPVFKNAFWYWKVDLDPEFRTDKLQADYKKIQYVILTSQLVQDVSTMPPDQSLSWTMIKNSTEHLYFGPAYKKMETISKFVKSHPNGDWVSLYKQNTVDEVLQLSWKSYKEQFITSSGQVVDPKDNSTTSQIVGYTLLRSVYAEDKQTFDLVWNWTRSNMYLKNSYLFSSTYKVGGVPIKSKDSSSEGDVTIAAALLQANKQWSEKSYKDDARPILKSIWESETVGINNQRYLVAGTWTAQPNREKYTVNVGGFTPLFYSLFAEADRSRPWLQLKTSMYQLIDTCSSSSLTSNGGASEVYLPPNWCNVTSKGQIVAAVEIDSSASDYSYEAFRSIWQISQDAVVTKDPRAITYLQKLTLFSDSWKKDKKIFSHYTHQGKAVKNEESLEQYASSLGYFLVRNEPQNSVAVYDSQISPSFHKFGTQYGWGDLNSVFTQNWLWLNVWLMNTQKQ